MVKRFEIKGYKITVFDRRKEIGCGSNNGRFENQFLKAKILLYNQEPIGSSSISCVNLVSQLLYVT